MFVPSSLPLCSAALRGDAELVNPEHLYPESLAHPGRARGLPTWRREDAGGQWDYRPDWWTQTVGAAAGDAAVSVFLVKGCGARGARWG